MLVVCNLIVNIEIESFDKKSRKIIIRNLQVQLLRDPDALQAKEIQALDRRNTFVRLLITKTRTTLEATFEQICHQK